LDSSNIGFAYVGNAILVTTPTDQVVSHGHQGARGESSARFTHYTSPLLGVEVVSGFY
jgi:hypothetical protein